jgi:hypothetical protein
MAKHTPCLRDFTEVHGYRPNIPGVPLKPELRVSNLRNERKQAMRRKMAMLHKRQAPG